MTPARSPAADHEAAVEQLLGPPPPPVRLDRCAVCGRTASVRCAEGRTGRPFAVLAMCLACAVRWFAERSGWDAQDPDPPARSISTTPAPAAPDR